MARSDLIIQPRLTLPSKTVITHARELPSIPRSTAKRNTRLRELMVILLGTPAFLALMVAAYWYLVPWPIYRVVALVVLLIVGSTCMSSALRGKTKQIAKVSMNTMSMKAVTLQKQLHKGVKPVRAAQVRMAALTQDTTTYLSAIRKSFLSEKK